MNTKAVLQCTSALLNVSLDETLKMADAHSVVFDSRLETSSDMMH